MRIKTTFLRAMTPIAWVVLAASLSCKRGEEPTEHEIAAAEAAKPLPKNAAIDPVVAAQRDIALEAVLEGDKLRVSVRNKTRKTLVVGPKNLAILVKGETQVRPFDPHDTGFPVTTLKPDSEQVGMFRIGGKIPLTVGSRLLFNHPECQPSFTLIR